MFVGASPEPGCWCPCHVLEFFMVSLDLLGAPSAPCLPLSGWIEPVGVKEQPKTAHRPPWFWLSIKSDQKSGCRTGITRLGARLDQFWLKQEGTGSSLVLVIFLRAIHVSNRHGFYSKKALLPSVFPEWVRLGGHGFPNTWVAGRRSGSLRRPATMPSCECV